MEKKSFVIFTIGHGTKSIDEFIGLLKTYNVQRIVDIRTIPKSRHNPQYRIQGLGRFLYFVETKTP